MLCRWMTRGGRPSDALDVGGLEARIADRVQRRPRGQAAQALLGLARQRGEADPDNRGLVCGTHTYRSRFTGFRNTFFACVVGTMLIVNWLRKLLVRPGREYR